MINTSHVANSSSTNLSTEQRRESRQSVLSVLRTTSTMVAQFQEGTRGTVHEVSPLLVDWLYRSATTEMALYQETGALEHRENLFRLQSILREISCRWRVAGTCVLEQSVKVDADFCLSSKDLTCAF